MQKPQKHKAKLRQKKERKTRIKRAKAEDEEALNANVAAKVMKEQDEDEE